MSIAKKLERLAELQGTHRAEKDMQYELDLDGYLQAVEEYGPERVRVVHLTSWDANSGAATLVVFVAPKSSDQRFRRFQEQAHDRKIGEKGAVDAEELLAASCVVYPPKDSDLYKATIECAPGVLAQGSDALVHAVQGRVAEEGK